jgi:hypothetical protein
MRGVSFFPQKNRLTFLSRTMETMFSLIDAYVDFHSGEGLIDVPYHYNERATLSILAGALWRSDPANLVLEEYRTDKSWTEGSYKGRQDIWFRAAGNECYGEAKQQWIPLFRPRAELGALLSVLGQEASAARQNLGTPNARRLPLGILFVVPYILKTNIEHAQDNLTKHYGILEAALGPWCQNEGCQVLWARYSRDELFKEAGCQPWSDGRSGSCPSLDTLLCTPV